MEKELQEEPDMSTKCMARYLQCNYNLTEITRWKLYKARLIAKGCDFKEHGRQYSFIKVYLDKILESNPGSMVDYMYKELSREELRVDSYLMEANVYQDKAFLRCFIALAACIKGAQEGCRPFFGVDGCHLKGPYGGVLLVAVCVDGNLMNFPIAWAIVEKESEDSWKWFLGNLKSCFGDDFIVRQWTMISDKQKGLIEAAREKIPFVRHRTCAQHLLKNLQADVKHPGISDYFWAAAKATRVIKFRQAMEDLKCVSEDA